MPRADVGVVGSGLAGLTAAIVAADAGARVHVVATGQATTHWASGAIDVAVMPGAATPREVRQLADDNDHPYRFLAPLLPEALETVRGILAAEGLDLVGGLDDPLRPLPTAIGATRPVAIVPDGMSARSPRGAPTRRSSSAARRASATSGRRRSRRACGTRPPGGVHDRRQGSRPSASSCRTSIGGTI